MPTGSNVGHPSTAVQPNGLIGPGGPGGHADPLPTQSALSLAEALEQQTSACKYAFYMARWKHKIYKRFVKDLSLR